MVEGSVHDLPKHSQGVQSALHLCEKVNKFPRSNLEGAVGFLLEHLDAQGKFFASGNRSDNVLVD